MTKAKDFKNRVRARMRVTGEPYPAARAVLLAQPAPNPAEQADRDQERLVARWFTEGRLRAIPARRKVRAAVLLEVLSHFTPGEVITEARISQRLAEIHPDFAQLRRELVAFGYLTRSEGLYRVRTEPPPRTSAQRRELPDWERIWLPRFLAADEAVTR